MVSLSNHGGQASHTSFDYAQDDNPPSEISNHLHLLAHLQ